MKKWVLLLLLFYASNSWAQYESIISDVSTSWNVFLELFDAFKTDSLSVVGDTLIDDIDYNIVKSQFSGRTYFIRESIDNSKVFLYSPVKDTEFLVFDLTLEKSDTFRIGTDQTEILIVDSVYSVGSRKHIRFNYEIEFALGKEKFEFIEGVGTNFGLFYQGINSNEVSLYHYLLCSYKSGELNYSNKSFYGFCNISEGLGISQNTKNSNITLFPNPANDKLIIDFGDRQFGDQKLLIYDAWGRHMNTTFLANNSNEIDISSLTSGIYYFLVLSNGAVVTKKIIVK